MGLKTRHQTAERTGPFLCQGKLTAHFPAWKSTGLKTGHYKRRTDGHRLKPMLQEHRLKPMLLQRSQPNLGRGDYDPLLLAEGV